MELPPTKLSSCCLTSKSLAHRVCIIRSSYIFVNKFNRPQQMFFFPHTSQNKLYQFKIYQSKSLDPNLQILETNPTKPQIHVYRFYLNHQINLFINLHYQTSKITSFIRFNHSQSEIRQQSSTIQ